MRILVLGGTKFLGRAFVEAALARRHELTLFNRGETNADLFPDVEKLRGDRRHDLSALRGPHAGTRSSTRPATRRRSCAHPPSCSATPATTSSSPACRCTRTSASGPTRTAPSPSSAKPRRSSSPTDFSNYGALKALCEQSRPGRVRRAQPDRAARSDRRPARSDGTVHLLGAPARARRRDPRAGPAGAPRRSSSTSATSPSGCSTASNVGVTGVFNATNEGVAWGELLAGADVTWVSDEHLVAARGRRVDGAAALARRSGLGGDAPDRRRPGGRRGADASVRSRRRSRAPPRRRPSTASA